jgi:hypothetical protein
MALTDTDARLRSYYNATFRDVEFLGCAQAVRTTTGGRFLFEGMSILGLDDPLFACTGLRFTSTAADDLVVEIRDSLVSGCRRGVLLGGDAEALIYRTRIEGCALRGVLAAGSSRARLWENTVISNGGSGSSEQGFGGVAVSDQARVDLGGGHTTIGGIAGTSPGRNVICDNHGPGGAPLELDSRGVSPVTATQNYWCTADAKPRIVGAVQIAPILETLP